MKKFAMAAFGGILAGAVVTTQVAGPLVAQEADRKSSVYEQLDLFGDIFERIRRHGLADKIRLPGFIPAEDLPLWYNSADAFVFPSVFEGFGLPVLEAMACGTPVIVSDASSLPEVAGSAGMCLPPHDIDAWTEGLRRAIHDDAWREQAAARGIEQASNFTWAETARQTIASYQRALGVT